MLEKKTDHSNLKIKETDKQYQLLLEHTAWKKTEK